ncbi:MAG: asparagine synthase (glutamine-hydrolyzing), partial [Pseudomonadota bacterium]|nr:asparagine synthase (glutamine-hydrolyzing) [Pseudomonadota bacterium]
MCGISGIFNFGSSEPVSKELISKMNNSQQHRGPDAEGVYISNKGRIGLGHQRLSIIDHSASAGQPMSNNDGSVWVTYNGEIYNHQTLRKELEIMGFHFRSDHSDTEVLVHGYKAWGLPGLLEKLDGMFGFAIWDEANEVLFIARDRVGVKPVYFAKRARFFVFASEIKAILIHPRITRGVGESALYHYLTYLTTPAPLTLFDGIYKVPAGQYIKIEGDGSFQANHYWSPSTGSCLDHSYLSGLDANQRHIALRDEVRKRLEGAVEKRMMSDAPYGAFLSGGIDSSLNVALMDKFSDEPVNTFTVGFSDHPHLNEMEQAQKVSKLFGTNHHEILINETDMIGYLQDLVYQQDEPLADWVCIPLHFVSQLAKKNGVKVIQVGEGSDEQFCGYNGYMKYLSLHHNYFKPFQTFFPKGLQGFIAAGALKLASSFPGMEIYADAILRASTNREAFWSGAISFWESQKSALLPNYNPSRAEGWHELVSLGLLPDSYLETDSYSIARDFYSSFDKLNPGSDQLTRMIYNEFRLRLPELLLMRVDKITMASSLEARVPFLDRSLVDLTMDIPMADKVRGGNTKYLLKKAAEGIIPDEIIYRKK